MNKESIVTIITFFVLMFFTTSCREMWGDHFLGNNLDLLEGDKKEDRIILYCSGKSGGACMSGIQVIPTYKRQFDEKGNYAEYIEAATSNKEWIIAKSILIKSNQENYWIINKDFDLKGINCEKINCDSIIQSHVIGPLNLDLFKNKKRELNIELDFE